MSKKPRKKPAQATPGKPRPSKESFYSRNRGKIALALGIVIGANSGSILRGALHASYSAYTGVRNKLGDLMTDGTPKKEHDSEADPIKDSIFAMPSPCDLREGTFLADSKVLERKCEDETTHPPECSCSMSYKLKQLRYTAESSRREAIALVNVLSFCKPDEGIKEGEDPTCDVEISDGHKFDREKYRRLENIPEPYRSTLEAFDPESYASFKRTTLVQDGNGKLLGIEDGNLGTAIGLFSIICGQLVPSYDGQFHLVDMAAGLDGMDLEQALQTGDKVLLREYMLNTTVLAHEAFGHAGNMFKPRSFCERSEPFEHVKNELYAHFISAKMLAFMIQRHPVLQDIFREDEAEHEKLQSRLRQLSICEPGLEEREIQAKELDLTLRVELLQSYLLAKKSGNWKELKYLILDRTRMGTWEMIAYTMDYYRKSGEAENFVEMNEKFEVLMNSDSPEKLFER